MRVTVSGSFNRHYEAICEAIERLKTRGFTVVSPEITEIRSREKGFVYLTHDTGSPATIEMQHLSAIRNSQFLYVVDPNGYIGQSTALEIGFAVSLGKPVVARHPPTDSVFAEMVRVESIESLDPQRLRLAQSRVDNIGSGAGLRDLQQYFASVAKEREYERETLQDLLLLLIEEVGELARAIASAKDLKRGVEHTKAIDSIAQELADCLIYILNMANATGVDMMEAVQTKERANVRRHNARSN